MRNDKWFFWFGGMAFFLLVAWSWRASELAAADKPVKVHILYTSDAVGYYEPCG